MKAVVMLSSYNGEKYIVAQIESILAQQCRIPFDLWVRDDGSSDNTRDILQRYADEKKLQWYTGENLKPAKSFLDLIKHCQGYDFYAFADQDDFWEPGKLQAGIARLSGITGPALYFANARLVDSDLGDLGRDVYKCNPYQDFYTLTCQGGLLGCTMVFNAGLAKLLQDAPMPEKLMMHDFYLAEVCALFDGEVFYDPTAHMQYRQHGSNVVGVSRSRLGAIKDRIRTITRKVSVTIAEQAQSILICYPHIPDPRKRQWLEQVAHYRKSLFRAWKLAVSSRTHYCNKNKAITLRLALLMRNR